MIVFTGDSKESGTHSNVMEELNFNHSFKEILNKFLLKNKKVSFKINGELNETGIRLLNDGNKSVLQKSSVDSFIMAVKK
jgi:hypothetical protein